MKGPDRAHLSGLAFFGPRANICGLRFAEFEQLP